MMANGIDTIAALGFRVSNQKLRLSVFRDRCCIVETGVERSRAQRLRFQCARKRYANEPEEQSRQWLLNGDECKAKCKKVARRVARVREGRPFERTRYLVGARVRGQEANPLKLRKRLAKEMTSSHNFAAASAQITKPSSLKTSLSLVPFAHCFHIFPSRRYIGVMLAEFLRINPRRGRRAFVFSLAFWRARALFLVAIYTPVRPAPSFPSPLP